MLNHTDMVRFECRCLELSLYSEVWVQQDQQDSKAKGFLAFLKKLADDATNKALEDSEPHKLLASTEVDFVYPSSPPRLFPASWHAANGMP